MKYDFATKTSIGIKGVPVKNLCTQLSGITIEEICECCTDKRYGKFLKYIKKHGGVNGREINNIGTILDRVPWYSKYEQIFSAGIEDIVGSGFSYGINDIPKGLIRLCKTHDIKLSNSFLREYKENPDAYLLAYNLEYTSLTDNDVYIILSSSFSVKEYYGAGQWDYRYQDRAAFNSLLNIYGYNAKALLNYLDYCKTYEAIEDMRYLLRELLDYCNMMSQISPRYDKYPRHFLTAHQIASRNYRRLKTQFDEEKFRARIDKSYEFSYKGYQFIYPNSTQDIKDEAAEMSNCVASYIDKVIDGECHILFLRKKDALDKSLVTIEVRNNKIVQAKRKFNESVTEEDQEAINAWNRKYKVEEEIAA